MPKAAAKPAAKKSAPKPTAKKAAAPPPAKPAPKPVAAKPVPPPPAPKPFLRTTGLSPKEQRLQALLAKAARQSGGQRPDPGAGSQAFHAKTSFAGKKTSFQRKAV